MQDLSETVVAAQDARDLALKGIHHKIGTHVSTEEARILNSLLQRISQALCNPARAVAGGG